jgi:hypothetical protein
MLTTLSESVKREATNRVLRRLGEEMIEVVKYHLRRSYAISFDPSDDSHFSLDQLHFGLCLMLGEGHANNLLNQIAEEIREISQSNHVEA